MKLIIAGKRDWTVSPEKIALYIAASGWKLEDLEEIVSGTAKGIDSCGEKMAELAGLKIKRFPPDWDKYKKAAGPIRNREMAKYADALLLIWDGKSNGSASMLKEARKCGLMIVQIIKE